MKLALLTLIATGQKMTTSMSQKKKRPSIKTNTLLMTLSTHLTIMTTSMSMTMIIATRVEYAASERLWLV